MTWRKRLLLCLGLLAALGAGTLGVWRLAATQYRINREGFDALRDGMTPAEVEETLGALPGDHFSGPLESDEVHGFIVAPEPDRIAVPSGIRDWRVWLSGGAFILVEFGPDGRLWRKSFTSVHPAPQPLLAKLRRWLRL